VRDADWIEGRAPVARGVGRELYVPALVRHARDDEPDAGPVVELLPDEPQLWRVVAHEHGGEGSAEAAEVGMAAASQSSHTRGPTRVGSRNLTPATASWIRRIVKSLIGRGRAPGGQ
jgi:hypothetical protein